MTLTTLGYGDISPAISATRTLAAFEVITGVVLLAILVGRIVGMLISQLSETNIDRRFDALTQFIRGQEQGDPGGADPTLETDDSSRKAPPLRGRSGFAGREHSSGGSNGWKQRLRTLTDDRPLDPPDSSVVRIQQVLSRR